MARTDWNQVDMVSNCTVPGGVGSITASGKMLQERMRTVCQQCRLWLLEINFCIVYMASLSLFELFGLSFARTDKNGDLIARASRKNFCSNFRESPQWPPKWMASRQALLWKEIHCGHWVQLACSGVAGTISKTKLKTGGHGFKLHRSRRCWLKHCIRQMPCLVSLQIKYEASWKTYMADLSLCELFGLSFARTGKNGDLIAHAWRNFLFQFSWKSPVAAKVNGL